MISVIKKIVLTGPACTGKSALAKELAHYFNTAYVKEYAREYILNLERQYTYEDVELIARRQIELVKEHELINTGKKMFFIDTYLVIIFVWFEVVFNKVPECIIKELKKQNNFVYLLCEPDLKWEPDPAREYGPEKQEELFARYEEILQNYNLKYFRVKGHDADRLQCAVKVVNTL